MNLAVRCKSAGRMAGLNERMKVAVLMLLTAGLGLWSSVSHTQESDELEQFRELIRQQQQWMVVNQTLRSTPFMSFKLAAEGI